MGEFRHGYKTDHHADGADRRAGKEHGAHSEMVKDAVIGPVPVKEKGTMALVLGVYRGDLAHVEIEAWME